MKDEPIKICVHCGSDLYNRIPTLPNGRVRACLTAQELGIELPYEKEAHERQEAKARALPWWRNGTVPGLPKREKPLKLDKIKDMRNWIEGKEETPQ